MTKVDTHNSIPDEHDGLSRSSRADQFSKGNKLELKLLLRIIKKASLFPSTLTELLYIEIKDLSSVENML